MNAQKMFVSLIPWALFAVMIQRHGTNFAGVAATGAAALAAVLLVKDSRHSGMKLIDVTGVTTFGLLAAASFAGGASVTDWVADYGRGACALVLATVMLASTAFVPFSEQYARESVPPQHWHTAAFRSTNRRISATWGLIVLVMAFGHLLAGTLDPATAPAAGARPIDLLLNWALPIGLILVGIKRTRAVAAAAQATADPSQEITVTSAARSTEPVGRLPRKACGALDERRGRSVGDLGTV